jgi:DNA polymerase III epsilon subunit-like protein
MQYFIFLTALFLSTNLLSEASKEPTQLPIIFAIVDVETTGLNPNYNEIIDIGLILIDKDLNEIARFNSKVLPLHPQRINSEARKINGFDLIAWKKENALSGEEAIKKLITFLSNLERKPYFIAFNSWFDSAFLSNLFRKHGYRFDHWFDYKVFDIPSMAMACGYFPEGDNFNDDLAKLLNVTPETKNPLLHTGESGVNYNYAILKSLKKKECFF